MKPMQQHTLNWKQSELLDALYFGKGHLQMANRKADQKIVYTSIMILFMSFFSQTALAENNPIEIRSITTKHESVKIQVPIVKKLTKSDSPTVKLNIKNTNDKIYKKLSNVDNLGYEYVDIKPIVISNNSKYLSLSIEQELSGGTTQYYNWNIIIDKSTGLMLSPNQALQRFGFSTSNVRYQISNWIKPCLSPDRKSIPEKCMSGELESFIEHISDDGTIDQQPSGVYLKDGNLGISFYTNKFTQSFEFDLKTKKLIK